MYEGKTYLGYVSYSQSEYVNTIDIQREATTRCSTARARAAAAADRGDLGGPRALTSLDRRARADATAQRLLAATRAVRELTGAVAERRRVGGGAQCGGATSARLARRQPPGATSIGARSGKCCPPRTRSASRACASTPACLRRRRA